MTYTTKDARRSAKAVTAQMSALSNRIDDLSKSLGEYLGIMDAIADAPMSGSKYMLEVERSLIALSKAYDVVRVSVQNVPEPYC